MTNGQYTLKDLAQQLGLSISTVSRALRNHPDVNDETKKRVRELASRLDYEPNLLAINLLRRRSNSIAVIVPKISYHLYAQAISGIESIAEARGYNIMICQSNESYEREVSFIRELNAIRVAGFIISVSSNTCNFQHFLQVQKKQIPLVFFNRECEQVTASKVVIDNAGAAYEAVRHLKDQGFRRIAYIGGPENVQISNSRRQGYLQALDEFHLEKNKHWIRHSEFSRAAALKVSRTMLSLQHAPDAILAFSDQLATGVMMAARSLELRIPEDLGIVGFNNEPADELYEPALTSIDQPAYDMGTYAAQMLFDQIEGETHDAHTKVLNPRLIIRDSSRRK